MLLFAKIIHPDRPIEDYVAEAKNHLRRIHSGDIIDWSTMHYDVGQTSFEDIPVTLFTLTVESAGSMSITFGESDV